MHKMSSLFVRELEYAPERGKPRPRYLATREYHPDAEWVANGEGVATRKWDGTCCCFTKEGFFLRRHKKGWKPVVEGDANAHWHLDWAKANQYLWPLRPGTYELCGPKIQGNAEGFDELTMVKHGEEVYPDAPRTFDELKDWLAERDIEGLVWHHPDGSMIKIKKCDFGLPRRPER